LLLLFAFVATRHLTVTIILPAKRCLPFFYPQTIVVKILFGRMLLSHCDPLEPAFSRFTHSCRCVNPRDNAPAMPPLLCFHWGIYLYQFSPYACPDRPGNPFRGSPPFRNPPPHLKDVWPPLLYNLDFFEICSVGHHTDSIPTTPHLFSLLSVELTTLF